MRDFATASKFENDFGPTQEGILLKRLDDALKSNTPKSNQMLQYFTDFHAKDLTEASNKFPLYALILMSIAGRIGSQSLFNQSLKIAQDNWLPWEDNPNGHPNYQKLAKLEWIRIARNSPVSSHLSHREKIDLTAHLIFRGQDPFATRDIEELSTRYREEQYGRKVVHAALNKFPNDGHIAASYVALSHTNHRQELAQKYAIAFPDIKRLKKLSFK